MTITQDKLDLILHPSPIQGPDPARYTHWVNAYWSTYGGQTDDTGYFRVVDNLGWGI